MFPGGREFGGLNKTEFLKVVSYLYLYFFIRHGTAFILCSGLLRHLMGGWRNSSQVCLTLSSPSLRI